MAFSKTPSPPLALVSQLWKPKLAKAKDAQLTLHLVQPLTPPRTSRFRNTSNLSPSKFNDLYEDNPMRTSPSPKRSYPARRMCWSLRLSEGVLNALAVLQSYERSSENVRPLYTQPVKYPSLPTYEQDYNTVRKLNPRSPEPRDEERYDSAPGYDPFEDAPLYQGEYRAPNVGRRRANALMNTPARLGHSQAMAKIYQEAQETAQLQMRTATKVAPAERPLLSTYTPKRRSPLKHDVRSDGRIPDFRHTKGYLQNKPLPEPVKHQLLPALDPVGRLSDDIPSALRAKASSVRPLRVRDRKSPTYRPDQSPGRISSVPSVELPFIRRTRPFPSSEDSGVCLPGKLHREDAFVDDFEQDGFEPATHIHRALPQPAPFEDPTANRVVSWLSEVDAGSSPERTVEIVEPLPDITPDLNAGIRTPSWGSKLSTDSKTSKRSGIGGLMCIPTLKMKFQPMRTGLNTLATPPRRPKIPAREFEAAPRHPKIPARETPIDDPFTSTPLKQQRRHASNSSNSRIAVVSTPELELVEKGRERKDSGVDVQDDRVTEGMAALELSPSVELFRKEKRPRRARCDGYFDDDILLSPGRGE